VVDLIDFLLEEDGLERFIVFLLELIGLHEFHDEVVVECGCA